MGDAIGQMLGSAPGIAISPLPLIAPTWVRHGPSNDSRRGRGILLGTAPARLALALSVAAVTTAAPAIVEPVTLTFEAVIKGCGESR